jgi:hypothetical protein
MAIKVPVSRYRKNNHLIALVICLALAAWCFYDGRYNKEFIQKHTNPDGTPNDPWLIVNRNAPPYLLIAGVLVIANFYRVRNQRVRIDEDTLFINGLSIPLKEVVEIDRTEFDTKGFFVLSYKSGGAEQKITLYSRQYDHLSDILDRLIEEISGSSNQEGKAQS